MLCTTAISCTLHCLRIIWPCLNLAFLQLIHTATPDKTRPSCRRLPVDRRRRDAGQAGSYA